MAVALFVLWRCDFFVRVLAVSPDGCFANPKTFCKFVQVPLGLYGQ